MGDSVVMYKEVKGGHVSFITGHDMSYLRQVLKLVNQYNPIQEPGEKELEEEVEKELEDAAHR